jgi:1,2-diacylglycerol 3-alpha-glucosyltransferase
VGSGTSIIESSGLGIPSIIGIESNNDGETYGFFSDLRGYSYNEDNLDIEKKNYYEILEIFFTSSDINKLSISHKNKASEFLIDSTSNMFINVCEKSVISSYFSYNKIRYSLSYFTWLILNKLKLNNELKSKFD